MRILLTRQQLLDFCTRKILLARREELTLGAYAAEVNIDPVPAGDEGLLAWFISGIDCFILPDATEIPILEHAAIPAGMLVVKPDSGSIEPANRSHLPLAARDNEALLIRWTAIRRALLFATVWFIKKRGIEPFLSLLNSRMSVINLFNSGEEFVYLNLIGRKSLPEFVPGKAGFHSSVSDWQFNWFGKALAMKYFKQNGGKMDDGHREWLLSFRSSGFNTVHPVPDCFKESLPLIGAYLSAIVAEGDDAEPSFSLPGICQYYSEESSYDEVLFKSLVITGFTRPMADNYFFTAGGRKLMQLLENRAFEATIQKPVEESEKLLKEALEDLTKAMTTPLKNLAAYYEMVNPGIKGRKWLYHPSIVYNNESMGSMEMESDARNLEGCNLVVSLENALYSLKARSGVIELSDHVRSTVHFVKDEVEGAKYSRYGYSWVKFNPLSGYSGMLKGVRKEQLQQLIEAGDEGVNTSWMNTCRETVAGRTTWILLLDEGYNAFLQEGIKNLVSIGRPENILTAFFLPEMIGNVGADQSGANKPKRRKAVKETDTSVEFDPSFYKEYVQKQLREIFPGCNLHPVVKHQGSEPWEFVKVARGVLKGVDSSAVLLVNLTRFPVNSDYAEWICRSFRDIIIYEPEMKYLFLNL